MSYKMQSAYKLSRSFYDDFLKGKGFFGKCYMKFFWGGADDTAIAETLLAYIPEDFSGTLLDVPVGTAVFTHKKWKKLSNARILCLDYSKDMLRIAKGRLKIHKHISCVRGDVGKLRLKDNSCDIVFCMNGIHVFPDKEKAFVEIHRVLKPEGKLLATYYIKGESKATDFLIQWILEKRGWFNPPYQTMVDVKKMLERDYKNIKMDHDKALVYFYCEKKNESEKKECL